MPLAEFNGHRRQLSQGKTRLKIHLSAVRIKQRIYVVSKKTGRENYITLHIKILLLMGSLLLDLDAVFAQLITNNL